MDPVEIGLEPAEVSTLRPPPGTEHRLDVAGPDKRRMFRGTCAGCPWSASSFLTRQELGEAYGRHLAKIAQREADDG